MAAKGGLKWTGEEIDALVAVASASADRSLEAFQSVLADDHHRRVLSAEHDALVNNQLDLLYNTLLEENLLKIIEPYTCVEVR